MKTYNVLVRYRTRSGVNAKSVRTLADDMSSALALASASVARQRGVIRVDGAETVEPDQWPTYRPSEVQS